VAGEVLLLLLVQQVCGVLQREVDDARGFSTVVDIISKSVSTAYSAVFSDAVCSPCHVAALYGYVVLVISK